MRPRATQPRAGRVSAPYHKQRRGTHATHIPTDRGHGPHREKRARPACEPAAEPASRDTDRHRQSARHREPSTARSPYRVAHDLVFCSPWCSTWVGSGAAEPKVASGAGLGTVGRQPRATVGQRHRGRHRARGRKAAQSGRGSHRRGRVEATVARGRQAASRTASRIERTPPDDMPDGAWCLKRL